MELEQYKVYVLSVDGSTCTVFRPDSPIVISEYVYTAQRMGTATLTATVRDVQCLDSLWTGREFVCLDESSLSGSAALAGSLEKFFLLHTPSSSKGNDDERYVHTLEFVSERDITLSSVYFLDAVPTSSYVPDKYRSNQFTFSFFGTLSEFVLRFNSVLSLRGLSSRFSVVLDASSIVVDGVEYAFAGPYQGVYAWTHTDSVVPAGGTEPTEVVTTLYTTSSAVVAGNNVYDSPSLAVIEGTVSSVTLPSDEVLEVSFDKRTLFEALQDAFQVYKVPFWFEGDLIHFGEGSTVVPEVTFEYGHDEELLSISKNNTNAKIVTRCTGIGGDTNIPYYYPNPTPKGTLGVGGTATGVTITNQLRFSDKVYLGETYTFVGKPFEASVVGATVDGVPVSLPAPVGPFTAMSDYIRENDATHTVKVPVQLVLDVNIPDLTLYGRPSTYGLRITPSITDKSSTTVSSYDAAKIELECVRFHVTSVSMSGTPLDFVVSKESTVDRGRSAGTATAILPDSYDIAVNTLTEGPHTLLVTGYVSSIGATQASYAPDYVRGDITCSVSASVAFCDPAVAPSTRGWRTTTGYSFASLEEAGLSSSTDPQLGDTIIQTVVSKIPPQQNLMPPIYRSSGGDDRWYNAINETYTLPDGSGYYHYDNVYNPLSPREYIEEFEDIYPTIRNLVDGSNNPLNVFDNVYFETGYNTHDTVGDDNTRKYSYFFARLKPLGFNIFDCAIENGAMTFEMIDGHCAGCKFALLVDDTDHNHVQVDGNGALVVGTDGRVDMSGSPQAVQNDTTSNYVWVCLQIDTTTFGDDDDAVMPGDTIRPQGSSPSYQGDSYVITNIALPQIFFTAAEEKLKHAILEFMAENNAEKYTYTIKFSRIWLAHHHEVRDALNEHAALYLRYGAWRSTPGVRLDAPLHIQQYTVRQQEGEPLPEVDVELTDEIEDSSGGLSEAISASVENIVNVVYGGSVGGGLNTALGDTRYLRRDKPETVANLMTFQKGWQTDGFTAGLTGSALTIGDDGKTSLEIDRLIVRDNTVLPSTTSTGGGESIFEVYEYDTTNHKYAAKLKQQAYMGSSLVNLDGVFTNGFMSAGGLNANSGGGGGGSTVTWEQLQSSGTQIANITINGTTTAVYAPVGGSGGGGTVTRVAMSAQNNLSIVSGSPITGDGIITIGVASGYAIPSSSQITAWTNKQNALSTTNKLPANYISGLSTVATTGSYNDLLNRPTTPTSLKNPYALAYNGKSYDGSVAGMEILDSDITGILGYTPFNAANLAQTTGTSTSKVMSQKAVTDAITAAGGGTVTAVKMNGGSPILPVSGVVDLGTVITSLSGYVQDGQMEAYVDSVLSDYALDNDVIHNYNDEYMDGVKTFGDGLHVIGWNDIYCEGEDETLEDALGYCVHTGGNETVNGEKTFTAAKGILMPNLTNKGSVTRPIYVSATGEISLASTYAGGTRVYLNGTLKGGSTVYIYAPAGSSTNDASAYGSIGNYLVSNGKNVAPSWVAPGSVASGNTALVTGGAVYTALQGYLPLTGGTLTGDLYLSSGCKLNLDTTGNKFLRYTASDSAWYFSNSGGDTYFISDSNYIYGGLYPLVAETPTLYNRPNLGSGRWFWSNLYAKRWYPKVRFVGEGTSDPHYEVDESRYIEYDTANDYFYVHGDLVVSGAVVAGQST